MSPHHSSIAEKVDEFHESAECLMHFEKRSVKCICPKCGITHVLKFLWTGNGTPRKYCHRCREVVSSINDQCIYESVPDAFRNRNAGGNASE